MTTTKQNSIKSILPAPYQALFSVLPLAYTSHAIAGCYLCSHVGDEQLLILLPTWEYHLLYWTPNNPNPSYNDTRYYNGNFSFDGKTVELDISLTALSSGSDANCETLKLMTSGGVRYLLQDIENIAQSIHWGNGLGQTRDYFVSVSLDDAIPEYLEHGSPTPPWDDLPDALQAITLRKTLQATITKIISVPHKDDEDGNYMVEINLGTNDGLTMNTPMCSPANDAKNLKAGSGN